jgi:hypothetical protein
LAEDAGIVSVSRIDWTGVTINSSEKEYNPSELATLPKKKKASSDHNPVPFCNAVQSLEAFGFNQTVLKSVTHFVSEHQDDWDGVSIKLFSKASRTLCLNIRMTEMRLLVSLRTHTKQLFRALLALLRSN